MGKIRVGIVGAAGYTGGELIRLLVNHPFTELVFAHSNSQSNRLISAVHTDLIGETTQRFTNVFDKEADVVFLCMSHGEAKPFLANFPFGPETRIIDLSHDFREGSTDETFPFVYGLPEFNRNRISNARNIANPGCFATAILLALLPAANQGLLPEDVHINGTTGSTGAGQALTSTSHFSWRNNNFSAYKVFEHQHEAEVMQALGTLQTKPFALNFIPNRGNFSRGILVSAYFETPEPIENLISIYSQYYDSHPFTHISTHNPDLKQVVNTNKCILYLKKSGTKLLVISVLDNLLKGASGQAIQNMNLMFALPETAALKLKAVAY